MPIIGFIFAIASVILGAIAIWIALKSDGQLRAIADLHFEEKLAIMASYRNDVFAGKEPPLKRIKHDIGAVSYLRKYANTKQKESLIREYIIPILSFVLRYSKWVINEHDEYDIYDIIEIALQYNIERDALMKLQEYLHYPFITKQLKVEKSGGSIN